jgi:acyl carrier protein
MFMHAIRFLAAIHEACEAPAEGSRYETPRREIRGWDSVSIASLLALLRDQFRLTISPQEILRSQTVADLLEAHTREPVAAKIAA